MMNIGLKLKVLRKLFGYTAGQMAELAGISTRYLYNIESGTANVTLAIIERYARCFAAHPKHLIGLSDELLLELKHMGQKPETIFNSLEIMLSTIDELSILSLINDAKHPSFCDRVGAFAEWNIENQAICMSDEYSEQFQVSPGIHVEDVMLPEYFDEEVLRSFFTGDQIYSWGVEEYHPKGFDEPQTIVSVSRRESLDSKTCISRGVNLTPIIKLKKSIISQWSPELE